MVKNRYIPQRGDIVWLSFSPTKRHEQSGKRPGLILTPKEFNEKSAVILIVPITSIARGYATEVLFDTGKTKGVVLTHQVRSIDWKTRNIKLHDQMHIDIVQKVQNILISLMQ